MVYKVIAYTIIAIFLMPIIIFALCIFTVGWWWALIIPLYLWVLHKTINFLLRNDKFIQSYGGNEKIGMNENVVAVLTSHKKTVLPSRKVRVIKNKKL